MTGKSFFCTPLNDLGEVLTKHSQKPYKYHGGDPQKPRFSEELLCVALPHSRFADKVLTQFLLSLSEFSSHPPTHLLSVYLVLGGVLLLVQH